MATGRADEAVRPSQPFQVVEAVRISREPSPKLPKGLRVVDAGEGSLHPSSIRPSPVKWISQTGDMDFGIQPSRGYPPAPALVQLVPLEEPLLHDKDQEKIGDGQKRDRAHEGGGRRNEAQPVRKRRIWKR